MLGDMNKNVYLKDLIEKLKEYKINTVISSDMNLSLQDVSNIEDPILNSKIMDLWFKYLKLKQAIDYFASKVWSNHKDLQNLRCSEKPSQYFIDKYGITKEAISEAYHLGRQDGRLTLIESIIHKAMK